MECLVPCLITGFSVLVIFVIIHIFLYMKLLELSRKRRR